MKGTRLRLGVNIDHVATLRNARGGPLPDPVRAAELAVKAGADGITAHLREDRRHIRDDDIQKLKRILTVPLNLEMAATEEMTEIALGVKPHAACIVPERRAEITTEGGLDAAGQHGHLAPIVRRLVAAGIRVSLFIDADPQHYRAAASLGAPVVEIHTGAYCDAESAGNKHARDLHLAQIRASAREAHALGLEVHAGHGLNTANVGDIAAIPEIAELNIGHYLVGEALFLGLEESIRRMRAAMDKARGS